MIYRIALDTQPRHEERRDAADAVAAIRGNLGPVLLDAAGQGLA